MLTHTYIHTYTHPPVCQGLGRGPAHGQSRLALPHVVAGLKLTGHLTAAVRGGEEKVSKK